jgi:sulfate adenylyltransferase
MSIDPHGGTLVDRLLTGDALEAAKAKAQSLPKLTIDTYAAFDVDCIAKGIFSPLTGFMGEAQVKSVMDNMEVSPGVPWAIPILLAASNAEADGFEIGSEIALEDDEGDIAAILTLSEKFDVDRTALVEKVYRTSSDEHPGVAYTLGMGDVFLAGDLDVLKARSIEHQDHNLTPTQTRAEFEKKGWKRIVAFQTRNPIHRAHEYLTKCALEMCDGLLIHPLMGTTKSDDIPGDVRMACYESIIEHYYHKDHTMLSLMPVNMRYAGPREAVMHAIIRRNYGCTHIIIGRDHAGVGKFYGTYDAHEIFNEIDADALGITPIFFDHSFFCKACGNMGSIKTCPHGNEDHVFLSGTKVRDMLNAGEMPPGEFTRPEVAKILIEWATA